MDLAGGARKLINELVKAEQIEVRRAEIVSRDLAKWVEARSQVSGEELATWISDHAQVTDFYAPTSLLDTLIERHLTETRVVALSEIDLRNPALEAEMVAHPEQIEPYTVYADFLQERGDPLGEWIALGILADKGGDEASERFARYRKLHDVRLMGGLGTRLAGIQLEWRFGMIRAIEQIGAMHAWPELLALRVASTLEAIRLSGLRPDVANIIVTLAAPSLRAVSIEGVHGDDLTALGSRELRELSVSGSRATLGAALPAKLERLVWRVRETAIEGRVQLTIRELDLELRADSLNLLGQLELPGLERLRLELEHLPLRELAGILRACESPITHLELASGRIDPATFATIAQLPIAKRITKLGLTGLELTDAMLAAMTPGDFTNLSEIDVSFNELTGAGVAHAKRFAPVVISTRQHKRGSAMEQRVRRFAGSRLQPAELISDPKHWKRSGFDGDLRWARYAGDTDYELYISKDLARFACSCPSSIQPCKHVIALALVDERTPLRNLPPELGLVARVGAPRDVTG